MFTSTQMRACFAWSWLALPLLLSTSCGDGSNDRNDAGPGAGGSNSGSGDEDASLCEPAACEGLPVPEIACASGPTIVVCERGADGSCRNQVRCEADDDAGSANNDGGSNSAGSNDGGGGGTSGQACGGIAGLVCPGKLFCNFEVSAGGSGCQGISDASGVCQERPQACNGIYSPVCGCDRHSYSSECDAHAKGAAVLHKDLCTVEECTSIGGRPEYSDGASTPMCNTGEDSFEIPGREQAVCCVKK